MARLARIVIPDIPHHITHRGNRRQTVFFGDGDCRAYLALLRQFTGEACDLEYQSSPEYQLPCERPMC